MKPCGRIGNDASTMPTTHQRPIFTHINTTPNQNLSSADTSSCIDTDRSGAQSNTTNQNTSVSTNDRCTNTDT
jgi:hypothetical protein